MHCSIFAAGCSCLTLGARFSGTSPHRVGLPYSTLHAIQLNNRSDCSLRQCQPEQHVLLTDWASAAVVTVQI